MFPATRASRRADANPGSCVGLVLRARSGKRAPRASSATLSDAEIDAEINDTLAAQLSGALDLSEGGTGSLADASAGRVDLSGDGAWEAEPSPKGRAATATAPGAAASLLGLDGAAEDERPDPRSLSR